MSLAKPLPVAVAALLAVVRRNSLLDPSSLNRLRVRLVRDEISDLTALRRWLHEGDVNRRVGHILAQLLPNEDDLHIGDCHVLAHLTAGGMGSVDLVEHAGQLRVCKTIKAGQRGETVAKRFRREAAITATFDHPHLVRCFGHGADEERLFLVLEWVPGGDVQLLIDAGITLDVADALIVLHQTALGLAYAHERKLVHRDIKPANLLVSEAGTIRVADFGLARSANQDASWMTVTGSTMGTPSYMPPEQICGDELDGRADLYALGCVLNACLTGHPPWQGTIAEVLHGHMDLEPPALDLLRTGMPPELVSLHRDLLAKDPNQRPASATILAERAAELLRSLQRDPEDGLSPRSVVNSTSRHAAAAVTEAEPVKTRSPAEIPKPPQTTQRKTRSDTLPPGDLTGALTASRVQLSVAHAGGSRIIAGLVAGDEITIGRHGQVCCPDEPRIGRIHCRLVDHDGVPAVIDDGSANGTWLDDLWLTPLRPCRLIPAHSHRLNLAETMDVTLRTLVQRTPAIAAAGAAGMGSSDGWDAVLIGIDQAPPSAWVRRRITVGSGGADISVTDWTGMDVEFARWEGAWVWREGDQTWRGLASGPIGGSGLIASVG